MTNNNAELVENNEHLLIKLLLLLPPKSIFRFLSVSKRWNSLIRDPFFLQTYRCPSPDANAAAAADGRLLVFLHKINHILLNTTVSTYAPPINILPTCPNTTTINKFFTRRTGYFINSTNGLILCCRPGNKFTVLNPITKTWVKLPPPPPSPDKYRIPTSLGLVSRDNMTELAADYIVVQPYASRNDNYPDDYPKNILDIETYSSKSRVWDSSKLIATGDFELLPEVPTVSNGVFHWHAKILHNRRPSCSCIAVYDPNDDIQNHLQLIIRPENSCGDSLCSRIVTRSPSDELWYGASNKYTGVMRLWILPADGSRHYTRPTTIPAEEWVLVHDIRAESLPSIRLTKKWGVFSLSNIFEFSLDGVMSWDPLVVLLRKKEAWFLYNIDTMTGELVRFDGYLFRHNYYRPRLCPFSQSSSLSSYAL